MKKSATTFLLVEDDANDVLIVQQEFKRASKNIRLNIVSDGIEAKRYLEGKDDYRDRLKFPIPQVILLDLKMPRFSGFDFLEWLRSKAPDQLHFIPVVVLSSSTLPQDIIRSYALGVSSYMTKPVNWEEFRKRLHSLATYWAENVETPEFPITVPLSKSIPAPSEAYRLAQSRPF
jgi:DNA-binding response OmpR family regulator